jgi:P4 family phage/plasmid primase-like protien
MLRVLEKYKTTGKENLTHTSITGGKYSVIYNDFQNFYVNYYKEVLVDKSTRVCLVERTQEKFKLFLDIESNDFLITDEKVLEIIKVYVSLDEKCKDYIVSKRKNRYHVHFYNNIVNYEKSMELFDKCTETLNICDEVIDTSVYRSGLRLLGSLKNTKSYNIDDYYRIYDIHSGVFKDSIKFEEFCNTSILYGIPDNKPQNIVTGTVTTVVKYEKGSNESNETNGDSISLLNELVKLNENVFDKDTILISKEEKDFNGTSVSFLKTSSTFCPFKDRKHIRESNPVYLLLTGNKVYMKCHDIDCKKQKFKLETGDLFEGDELSEILEFFPITQFSIANYIFEKYKDRFRIDSLKTKNWYEFDGVKWSPSNEIDILISTEIVKDYLSLIPKVRRCITEEEDAAARIKLIYKTTTDLQTVGFKNAVLSQLQVIFDMYDPKFFENLDTNPNLMGFENGVYDFKIQEFRKTKTNDYISFTTGMDYTPIEKVDQIVLQEVYDFLDKIIPNKNIQTFLLKVLAKAASCTRDEKMYFWTGMQGSNGKSTLIALLELAFGDYTMPIETSLLTATKRSNPGAPSPHLIVLKGRRYITMQEPGNDDSINVGIMKQYSGGDTITGRDLFKPTVRFKLQGKMIMCSNFPPIIDSQDGGTLRRIVYIEFTSKFCENPKKPNEFKIDPDMYNTLRRLAPVFASVIIDYYSKFLKEGNDTPKEVLLATNRFNAENDKFGSFFDNFVIDTDYFTSIPDLYSKFTVKWAEDFQNIKVPDIREFKKALQMKFGREIIRNRIRGYLLKDSRDSEDSEEFEEIQEI